MMSPSSSPFSERLGGSRSSPARRHLLLVLLAAGFVYWTGLGTWGLSYTEGHRVIPAWEMMESGDYLVPRLFGQPYLRKPPGFAWAIVLASQLVGQTELAARLVSASSATLGAVAAFGFARRWFGPGGGLAAGLAAVLTPLFWGYGRAAEIEALHNLATQLAMLGLLDLLLGPLLLGQSRSRLTACWLGGLVAWALVVMVITKGPAGLPCVVAVAVGACITEQSIRPLGRWSLWLPALVAAMILAGLGLWVSQAVQATGEPSVVQSPSRFLWNAGTWSRIILLGPLTLLWGLPTSLAIFFPFLSPPHDDRGPAGDRMARSLALATLLALGIYTALGIDNPRYAMPALTGTPVLVPYALRSWQQRVAVVPGRCRRLLASPGLWSGVLLGAAAVWIGWLEVRRGRTSGREPAIELARHLPDGAEIWADGMVEARPELLLYARHEAARAGRRVRIRWEFASPGSLPMPPAGQFLLLLPEDEVEWYRQANLLDRLEPVAEGRVHKYRYTLFRVGCSSGEPAIRPLAARLHRQLGQ